jgi:hypothetical protein
MLQGPRLWVDCWKHQWHHECYKVLDCELSVESINNDWMLQGPRLRIECWKHQSHECFKIRDCELSVESIHNMNAPRSYIVSWVLKASITSMLLQGPRLWIECWKHQSHECFKILDCELSVESIHNMNAPRSYIVSWVLKASITSMLLQGPRLWIECWKHQSANSIGFRRRKFIQWWPD